MRDGVMLDLGRVLDVEKGAVSHNSQDVLAKITLKTGEEISRWSHPGKVSEVRSAGMRLHVLEDQVCENQINPPIRELVPIAGQQIDRLCRQRSAPSDHRVEIKSRHVLRNRLQIWKTPADTASKVEGPLER